MKTRFFTLIFIDFVTYFTNVGGVELAERTGAQLFSQLGLRDHGSNCAAANKFFSL